MKIAVLSDGAWGTALSRVLADNGHQVVMWGPFPDYLDEMRRDRVNTRFLPGVSLPESLILEADMAQAVRGAGMILLATPTQYLRSVLVKLKATGEKLPLLVNVAKGIELGTDFRISQMVYDILGKVRYAVLSGPSHAEEVSRGVPTLVTAAAGCQDDARLVQTLFMNEQFRVYTSSDVVGVELGGSLKNVMAIAAGIIDGMKLGDNPKAAMMTRAVAEMGRLGAALGGSAETFSGLSGIGDLIVTCCSGHSRNRHVGEELGRGKKLDAILKEMGMVVAEGVATTRSAHELAHQSGVETPIVDQIYQILYDGKSPVEAIRELMSRAPRAEY